MWLKNPVLIVEENDAARISLRRMVEQGGYPVEIAGDAREALAQVESHHPCLVILNLNLSEHACLEFLEFIARRSPIVPMVMLSSLPARQCPRRISGLGPLLSTPPQPGELLNAMKQSLEEPREVRLRRFCAFLETRSAIEECANGRSRPESGLPASTVLVGDGQKN